MKRELRILLIVILMTSFSTVVYAQRAEYKKLNQRMALLYKNGKIDKAIEVAKEVVTVAEETFGENHSYVSSSLNNLAMLHFKNGDYKKAKLNYNKVLLMTENLVGKTHPKIIKILENIKKCCKKLGENKELNAIDQRLESLRRSTSG